MRANNSGNLKLCPETATMPAPTPVIFTVTEAGRLAALSAGDVGLSIKLATLRASTGSITPDGSETALTGTLRGSWAVGGGVVNEASATLRFFALVQSPTTITDIRSLGLFTDDDVLFAIASTTDPDPLIVCHANIDFLPSFGVRLPDISASSIVIETDPNAPLAQLLMTQHQAAANPHPQYLRLDSLESLNALYIDFLKKCYPVGTPYFSKTDSRNPKEILGFGVWAREQGRVLVGYKEGDPDFGIAGNIGGEKEHTLTVEEMPEHGHPVTTSVAGAGDAQETPNTLYGGPAGTTGLTGGGEPHNNLQPFIVYHWWVRTG